MAIPSCLVDTNILLRLTRRADPEHGLVQAFLSRLVLDGTNLHYAHQNIAELWNVMTRPVDRNGFGLSIPEAEQEVRIIESGMTLLADNQAVYGEWRKIVVRYKVRGVHVHDARLAAVMYAHNLEHLLTLNPSAFSRFEGITIVHPARSDNW
jgi:predicted nucleic acid-binding protein